MIVALLLTFIFSLQQDPKIVTCTVVKVDQSVSCPTERGMELFTLTDEADAREIFDEWRLVAPLQGERVNTDAPLGTKQIQAGDKVKATITIDRFKSISSCEVRVWRNIKQWRQFRQGEVVPNTLFTLPDDCQSWYGKN
jgi:hypothetical protein